MGSHFFTCQKYFASAIFAQGTGPLLYGACSFKQLWFVAGVVAGFVSEVFDVMSKCSDVEKENFLTWVELLPVTSCSRSHVTDITDRQM